MKSTTYEAARPQLRTGDLVFLCRLTLRAALRAYGWRGIFIWFGNAVVALMQWRGGQAVPDGMHNLIHVGLIVRNDLLINEDDELLLAEFTACARKGLPVSRLSTRIAGYPGTVLIVPLLSTARKKLDTWHINRWLAEKRYTAYNYGGLLFPTLQLAGWRRPGARFCSEAVVEMLCRMGALPRELPLLMNGHLTSGDYQPHQFSPAEVTKLCVLDWRNAVEIER